MDPNTLNEDIKEEHLKDRKHSFKDIQYVLRFHYIFLLLLLFIHNCELIDERMLIQKISPHYLKMKVKNEILVQSLAKPPLLSRD